MKSTIEPRFVTCTECEEQLDLNDDYVRQCDDDAMLCEDCEFGVMKSASTVFLFTKDQEMQRCYVNKYFAQNEDGEEINGKFIQKWISTSGWRGYNETSIKGFAEVKDLTGWTTGWTDETTANKATFNDWAQTLIEGESTAPVDMAIVFDVTSNVFSTAVGVWVKDGELENFKQWLGGEYEILAKALG